jgi:predicted glutamine amidotransferase
MCGHVGIAGDLRYDEEKILKKMLLFDYFRGMDSTGFAAIKHTGEAVIAKVADNPLILFDMNKFKSGLSYMSNRVFMGHNRAATRGGINNANAHPFQCDHIIGTHNGTLTTKSTKALEDALGETFSVDSLALFTAISRLGIDETIKLCETGTTSSDGAWSLVWYDQQQGSINFLRNKWRPMWLAFSEDHKRLFWASEWPIISSALNVGDDTPQKLSANKEGYTYLPTDVDMHYRFDVAVLKEGSKNRPKPACKKLEGKEPAPYHTPAKDDPFGHRSGQSGMGFHTTQHSTTTSRSENKDVVHLLGDNDNPLAGTIKRDDFEQMAKYGCAWCQSEVNYDDKGICVIEKDQAVLCRSCSGDVDVSRVYGGDNLMTILSYA